MESKSEKERLLPAKDDAASGSKGDLAQPEWIGPGSESLKCQGQGQHSQQGQGYHQGHSHGFGGGSLVGSTSTFSGGENDEMEDDIDDDDDDEDKEEKVFETREVLDVEGDRKKIRYTRKISKAGRHCHSDNPTVPADKKSRNKLILASILCLLFMICEIVGGIMAGSLAIISDAAHLLTDFASFMISLLAIYLASRPATQKFNYGWHRAEILGAFTSIIMLWILTGVLAYEAVERVIKPDYEIDATIMLITAGIGVGFNVILGTTLHQHGHSHGGGGHGHSHGGGGGHGHSHGASPPKRRKNRSTTSSQEENQENGRVVKSKYGSVSTQTAGDEKDTVAEHIEISMDHSHEKQSQGHGHSHGGHSKKKETNINVKAAFIHVVGDLLQSIGVLVAAFLIYFKPEWKIADPICTFMFSLIVLVTTVNIMKDILVVLMEGKPQGVNFADVRETLLSVDKVKDTHNLRMWSLTMDKMALSVHLVVEENFDAHEVLNNASQALRMSFNIMDITIQIEEYVRDMDDCDACVGP